jgi:hypothetical protein
MDVLLTWFICACHVQASSLVKPARASSSYFDVKIAEVGVINLLSGDTEEALELLSLSPTRGPCSQLSKLRSSFNSYLFEDWPKVNDMAYVALTADASSSYPSMVDSLHGGRKCTRQPCSWVTSSRKPR